MTRDSRDMVKVRDFEVAKLGFPVSALTRSWKFKYCAVLLAGLLLAAFASVLLLQQIGAFLIVEDSLRPAMAIVALAGQTPFRELEAARLYRAGLAPQVVIVREAPDAESAALQQLGIAKPQTWELSRAVLIQQGVPDSAITIPVDEGIGTLEELEAVYKALVSQRLIEDVRREGLGVRGAPGHKEHGARSTEPTQATQETQETRNAVILVTSKFHTRRTRLIWQYVTKGRSQPIVRGASGDPFDSNQWWQRRRFALAVMREYMGLANYYAGFPVAP